MWRIVTWIILLLIMLPSLFLYSKNLDYNALTLSIVPIIFFWALLKNSRYLMILYPFVLIVPFILFYIHFYGSSLNEQILSIVIETNWQEALGFLGSYIYIYIGFLVIWLIGVTTLFWKNHLVPVYWNHRSRWWTIIAVNSITGITIIANYLLLSPINNIQSIDSNNFLATQKNNFIQEFKNTYPSGLIVSLVELYKEQKKINMAFSKNEQFSFHAISSQSIKKKQLIVLVIGETSRRANWQLNGYERDTNPLLSTQAQVVNFTDMLSISNATRSSIPILLTRKPAEQVNRYDFAEKSVISAFKEAGFQTYWMSNQQKFGTYDSSTSVYAKEADNIIFLNKTNYTNRGEKDAVILPVFKKILESSEEKEKIFIVIHTLGSHFDYSHRYPLSFDIFKPSLNDLENYSLQDRRHKQHITNSYDNSILYTDYVLNELIENMKVQRQTESFLLYSSDHGEDLFDVSCDKSGHGNETPYNFEIASLAWYSKTFADNNPEKLKKLLANSTKKINHTSIFPTLIDAADITIPNYTRERSLLSDLRLYPRLMLGGKNYDNSIQQGSCREI